MPAVGKFIVEIKHIFPPDNAYNMSCSVVVMTLSVDAAFQHTTVIESC